MAMPREFRRAKPTRVAKPRFLIVCEGSATEPAYLEGVLKHLGNRVILDIKTPHSDPKSIVSLAAKLRKDSIRAARKDRYLGYEQIWCVFDRDEHPFVAEALEQARANKIQVAFSDPNFELWLLLHFQEQTAEVDRGAVARLCRSKMPGYNKQPDMQLLIPHLEKASQRAEALCARQKANDRERLNPWTEMHLLVRALEG